MLKVTWAICRNKINACWAVKIFVTSWKMKNIFQITKFFHQFTIVRNYRSKSQTLTILVDQTTLVFKMGWKQIWWRLHEQFKNHSLFLDLTSTKRVTMLHSDLLSSNLDCISLQIYSKGPTPFPFLSHLNVEMNPWIKKEAIGKELLSFVLNKGNKSILLSIAYQSASKFFKFS